MYLKSKSLSTDLNEVRQEPCGHGGGVLGGGWLVLGRENNIPEHLLCTRPCSRGLGDSNEKAVKHQHCLLFNCAVCSVLIFYIIPFFDCFVF